MQVKPNIYNVGVSGNNAYLITGEKNVLIDTVSAEQSDELIKNIGQIIPADRIDYLIINHTEPDKSGAAGAVLEHSAKACIYATVAGLRNLKEMLNRSFNERIAKDNEELVIGGMTLKFLITPNINWPDSMAVYEKSTKTLFSCDLYPSNKDLEIYPDYAKNAIERILSLDIDLVCPGRGEYAARGDFSKTLLALSEKQEETIVILYATRYGATGEMAKCIEETLQSLGKIKISLYDVSENKPDASVLNNAAAIIAGSATIYRNADVSVLKALTEINAVKLRHKPFFTFGSYGWSGEGAEVLHNLLKSCGMKAFSKPYKSIFNMSGESKGALVNHTKRFFEFYQNEKSRL